MLVRPFRFILPVLAVVGLQWGLGATGKTSNCNAVGMEEPYWGLISSFAGYSTLVFDLVRLLFLSGARELELELTRFAAVYLLRGGHPRRSDFCREPLDDAVVLPGLVRRLRHAPHAREPLVQPVLDLRRPRLLQLDNVQLLLREYKSLALGKVLS